MRSKILPKGKDWLSPFAKDILAVMLVMAFFYIQHLLSFRFGIDFEEGASGNAYYYAIQGLKPYLDFEWIYGPFSFLVYPGIMKIFGVNLAVLRLSYIVFASLVIPLAYFLAKRIMPLTWAALASFLAVDFFDVPYYTYNHVFAVLGELACLLMVLRGIHSKKYIFNFIWAGIFASMTVLTKPFFSGILLITSVLLFLIILKLVDRQSLKFGLSAAVFLVTIALILSAFSYFYLGSAVKNFFAQSTPFSADPIGALYDVKEVELHSISQRITERFSNLIALNKFFLITSFKSLKQALVNWFDDFIFCLPFLVGPIIFIVSLTAKKRNSKVINIFKKNKPTFLLLVISAIVISCENLTVGHRMNRTFNTQTTLILLMFLFYLWQILVSRKFKPVVFCITILFVLGLSFLHFFRYPWSRSREFRAVLKLERSGGILVRPSEKSLYEGLSAYLSQNLNKDDKIVVLGYDPQFIFLTGYQSLFPDQEYIFLKLELLMKLCPRDPKMLVRLHSVESKIIFRIQSQKPKVILDIVSEKKEGLFKGAVAKYIRDNYTLRRTFGPGQIYDMKSAKTGWARVDLYALR